MIPHSRPTIGEKTSSRAVARVLRSGWIAQGRETERFERETAAFVRVAAGAAVSSGTAALHLALPGCRAQDRGPRGGSRLLLRLGPSRASASPGVPPFSWTSSGETRDGYRRPGAPKSRRRSRRRRLRAPAGLFGPIDKLRSPGIPVIEDCAQSLGPDPGEARRFVRNAFRHLLLRDEAHDDGGGRHGAVRRRGAGREVKAMRCSRESARGRAYPYAMNDMEAALGKSQLARFPLFSSAEGRSPGSTGGSSRHRPGVHRRGRRHRACLLSLHRAPARRRTRARHRSHGGERNRMQEAFRGAPLDSLGEDLPGAREAYATLLSIPLYPSLSYDEVMRVARALKDVLAGVRA